MFGFRWLLSELKDEMDLAQAKMEANKVAKKHMAEAEKEHKMTREEAYKIAEKICGRSMGDGNMVDVLEVLGLLKFDEPIKSIEPSPAEKGLTQAIGTYTYARVKQWLSDHGYEIVKTLYPAEKCYYAVDILKNHGYEIIRPNGTKA